MNVDSENKKTGAWNVPVFFVILLYLEKFVYICVLKKNKKNRVDAFKF